MNIWHNLHKFVPEAANDGWPAPQFRPIEVDGVFLGAAVEHQLGVRFIALDERVSDMDQSIWPNVDYAYRSVRQMFKSTTATIRV